MAERPEDLQIPLTDLRRRVYARRLVELSTKVDGLKVSDTEVDPEAPVEVSVVVEAVPEGVTVTGTISATWRGPCHLCLDEVRGALIAEVKEVFSESPPDEDVYKLHREYVDLTPMLEDALQLELPLFARCPNGGVGECDRAPDLTQPDDEDDVDEVAVISDPRWSVLESMTFDEDN